MTRIAFVGDVHVGNHKKFSGEMKKGINERCENVLYALSSAVNKAKAEKAETLVILGDLFDNPRPSPQMIMRVQEIIEQIPTIILAGNHDQCSDSPGDNALAPLYPVAEVIDDPDIIPVGRADIIAVPYLSGDYTARLEESVGKLMSPDSSRERKRQQILCFHAGIVDKKTPEFLSASNASVTKERLFALCDKYNLCGALAGHWHTPRQWHHKNSESNHPHPDIPFAIQAGALAPTGFSDRGTNFGKLFVYDTDTMGYAKQEVCGPRFLDVTLDQDITSIGPNQRSELEGCKLYIRINVNESEMKLGETVIKAGIDSGAVENGELIIDNKKSRQECLQAAEATRSAKNIEEALSMYTSKMPIKGIDEFDVPEARLEILTKALEYLRKCGAD